MTSSTWIGAMVSACLIATPAHAQTPSSQSTPSKSAATRAPAEPKLSYWGVLFSATPSWNVPSLITDKLSGDGGSVAIVGKQFAIGLVHGRAMSGDWGVTFVHEPVTNGSRGSDSDTECGYTNGPLPGGCFNTSGGGVTQGVTMTGVQVHKYIPFALIKRRVQIGMEFAGGIAKLSGTLQKTSSDVTNVQVNQKTGAQTGVLTTTVTNENVSDELLSKVPIGHIAIVGALVVNPAIKVRWEGGFLMPGQSFSTIAVTYLFGAH